MWAHALYLESPEAGQNVGFDLPAGAFCVLHVLRAVELHPMPGPKNIADQMRELSGKWRDDEERGLGLRPL